MRDDNIVVRTRDGNIVGITLLNGSSWMKKTG